MELVLIVAQFSSFFKGLYVHNKLADITSLVFLEKANYFSLKHVIKRQLICISFDVSLAVIVNKEV